MTSEQRFDRIENALDRMATTLGTVVDNQHKFDTVLSVLAEAQVKLTEEHSKLASEMRALERQWQAYLLTIRPQ